MVVVIIVFVDNYNDKICRNSVPYFFCELCGSAVPCNIFKLLTNTVTFMRVIINQNTKITDMIPTVSIHLSTLFVLIY